MFENINKKEKPSFLENLKQKAKVVIASAAGAGIIFVASHELEKEILGPDFSEDYHRLVETNDRFNGELFCLDSEVRMDAGYEYIAFFVEGKCYVTTNNQIIDFVKSHPGQKTYLKKDESGVGLSIVNEKGEVLEEVK